ncbi:HEPN domain-containing protein [Spirosoma rhododendri]|uniref:HEPN domain-containing protein n=1 Tax=Spirosoma rhododendri TaxID=2728024 RepID=A0A7L5DI06_9BACT|nr:HEPN domain-containing protein [Spirosoma rhododendri]QJD78004.1 HEPN domain-containing protein [Spirosoma rhododendri]
MKRTKEEVVAWRLQKSTNDLDAAKSMVDNHHWDGAVNRLYYAAFHAVTAAMLNDNIRVKSHVGVKLMLGEQYSKAGRIDEQWAKFYARLFRFRQDSDYEDFAVFTADDVVPLLAQTEEFIAVIKQLIDTD